ncbi:hypothetical protein RhiirA4_542503, partial [Rhizophagus irregularis]
MAEEYVVISGEIVVVVVVVIIGVFVEIIDDDDDIENSEHNCERAEHILSEYNHVHIDSCLNNHTEKSLNDTKIECQKSQVHVIVLAVALYGAALQAAILLENTTEKIKDILLHDVNAFNIVTSGDVITPFIEYNHNTHQKAKNIQTSA